MEKVSKEIVAHEMQMGDDEESHEEEEHGDDDGMSEKLKGWEARKARYTKIMDKGKVDKLEKVKAKQQAKLEKAKEKGKSEAYIAYKASKVEWTTKAVKAALIVKNMKDAGLM